MFKIYLTGLFLGVLSLCSSHAQSSVKKTAPSVKKAVTASKPKSPNFLIYENINFELVARHFKRI